MTRWVLLRHDLPDGSHHFDWLVELPIWGEHRLLAWRLATPAPIEPASPTFRAEGIPLHRAAYLDYEGPVSGNRGTVERLARGQGRVVRRSPDHVEIKIQHADRVLAYRSRRLEDPRFVEFAHCDA